MPLRAKPMDRKQPAVPTKRGETSIVTSHWGETDICTKKNASVKATVTIVISAEIIMGIMHTIVARKLPEITYALEIRRLLVLASRRSLRIPPERSPRMPATSTMDDRIAEVLRSMW
jgi:hypothetical protein